MGYVNLPPSMKDIIDDLAGRLRRLETATRFTAPIVTVDPSNPRNGDIWINSTTNQLKAVDALGTIRVITWV